MHLSSSELGFLLFDKNTLWNPGYFPDDNLLTKSDLCILSGPEHYNFPYTKIGISSNKTWNSGDITYSEWNWQTSWADKYKADPDSDEIKDLKGKFSNYVCFTN